MIFYETNPDNENDILIAFEFLGETVIKEGRYYQDEDDYYDYDGELIENVVAWTHKPVINLFK